MCETANQQSISSHVVVYMASKMRCCWFTFRRCFVNCVHYPEIARSLRDAKPAGHLVVWFTKHCLAEHCLSFRGDSNECEKQFCFVFRICLAFLDSRLHRALGLKFGSAARLSKGPGSVWNCLWGHALKRYPGINHKSSVLYPGPGFLSSATWSSLPKKHYNGLID